MAVFNEIPATEDVPEYLSKGLQKLYHVMIPSDRMAGAITKLKKKMADMKKVKTNQRR